MSRIFFFSKTFTCWFLQQAHEERATCPRKAQRPKFRGRIQRLFDRLRIYQMKRCCECSSSSRRSDSVKTQKIKRKQRNKSHSATSFSYLVSLIDSFLGSNVIVVISQAEETIVIHKVVVNVTELFGVVGAKESRGNLVNYLNAKTSWSYV